MHSKNYLKKKSSSSGLPSIIEDLLLTQIQSNATGPFLFLNISLTIIACYQVNRLAEPQTTEHPAVWYPWHFQQTRIKTPAHYLHPLLLKQNCKCILKRAIIVLISRRGVIRLQVTKIRGRESLFTVLLFKIMKYLHLRLVAIVSS